VGSRTKARRLAVDILFQSDVTGADGRAVLSEWAQAGRELPEFTRDLVEGVVREQLKIDPLINKQLAEGWRLTRVDSILRAILRAGAYEILSRDDVPARVVISEYVDIAHAFFADEEPKVVNGILDRIGHKARPREFTAEGRSDG